MANFGTKITKHCGQHLESGETVLAGLFCQPPGAIAGQVAHGAIGPGVVGRVVAQSVMNAADKGAEGLAINIPKGNCVLGLTDRRLLVFGHSKWSGRPSDLHAGFPLHLLHDLAAKQGKVLTKLAVQFTDGSSIDFDVVRTSKPGPFLDAWQWLRAQRQPQQYQQPQYPQQPYQQQQ